MRTINAFFLPPMYHALLQPRGQRIRYTMCEDVQSKLSKKLNESLPREMERSEEMSGQVMHLQGRAVTRLSRVIMRISSPTAMRESARDQNTPNISPLSK